MGGIRFKVAAARRVGASVLLVPTTEEAAARAVAGGDMWVVGVSTLAEAVGALGGTPCMA